MTVLSLAQRKLLSDTVAEARDVVEAACAQRIAALGVAADRAPEALSEEERRLRRGLRARARQLGSVEVLVSEAGYEHWHRMLFARYLADNNLLVDDHTGQPVTIDEVADYATELGEPDMWEVAARFAAAMLPGIFRQDDPLLQIRLPVETRQRLEELLGVLPVDIITAEDSLGWVYQYWQARRKDEVNRSERKIGGADLAPVTQLFTEDYMVRFLLENSIGAWWAARHPDSDLLSNLEYLRSADNGTPAAGTFKAWPASAAEVTVMDPCCGSGHFLVAAFGMLWQMRAEEEGLDTAAAQDAVLRDNLFGLELDPRCTQIATFALALQAWKAGGGWRQLPMPNIACSGLPVKAPAEEWTKLAAGDHRLENALVRLHILFRDADTLGSLIDPRRTAELTDSTGLQHSFDDVDWDDIAPLLERAAEAETADPATAVLGADAAGIARAADYLTRCYTLIATNPPWLQRTRQTAALQAFGDNTYSGCGGELALMMLSRCRRMLTDGGTNAFVTPQQWLEIIRFADFRRETLSHNSPFWVVSLGAQAFSSPMHPGNRTALYCEKRSRSRNERVRFLRLQADTKFADKPAAIIHDSAVCLTVSELHANPEHRIVPMALGNVELLSDYAYSYVGAQSHDASRFTRRFWEIRDWARGGWIRLQSNVSTSSLYAGREYLYLWEGGTGELARLQRDHPGYMKSHYFQGDKAWGRTGIAIGQMYRLEGTLYTGDAFDNNTAVIIPNSQDDVAALWCFCESGELNRLVRTIDSKMGVTNSTLTKVPIDISHWRSIATERFPDGLPEPWSDDPTQWLFKGDPVSSKAPLQVAVARLLGYTWPHQEPDDLEELADTDGVVCLPAVGGEPEAADRLLQLLAQAYEGSWSPTVLDRLLSQIGAKGSVAGLAAWLRNGFFKDHCRVFSNRPFIWQVWDGTPDGFSALVNYHRLGRRLLERLTYDYLGNWWIGRVRGDVANEIPGAERQLAAAEQLKTKLQLILEGEPPYDIYVRWKSLAEQPTGWDPDLDDGVRLNIRPFMVAGILRSQPKINWNKDRGKNPDGSDRPNDLHFTIAQKRAARGTP